MATNTIIQKLEKEQKDNLYNHNNVGNLKNDIESIKSLFGGYLASTYYLTVGWMLGFVSLVLINIDESWWKIIKSWEGIHIFLFFTIPIIGFALWGFYMNIRGNLIDSNYITLISRLTDFHRIKGEIQNSYDLLLGKILSDIKSPKINIEDIEIIKNNLENLTFHYSKLKGIETLLKPELYIVSFKKNKHSFIYLLNKIRSQEVKYAYDLKVNISEKINIWTSHHQSELQELEKSIGNQANQTENTDGKLALESQKVRLQSYIENINNLVK